MRVVVIGNGMVGSRFVDELAASDPHVEITVLGREPHEPYNRVLLSAVVAGTTQPQSLALPTSDSPRVRTLTGVGAVRLDRDAQVVTDSRGENHRYDRLVFATGSQARIPNIQGVATDRGLMPGVSVLKDLDDVDRIEGVMGKARRATVLGAGVLGIEVATGLVARGLSVTLVHHSNRLMERQLGDAASRVTANSLERLGITVVTETSIARAHDTRGVLSAVRLTDGTQRLTDLLVMCAGTVPETALARAANLPCERGIVVGDSLASPADPLVFAIGDCAQPPQGATGLVAQGWEQASRLVSRWTATAHPELASAPSPPSPPSPAVRVKATGLDVVTMGLSGTSEHSGRDLRAVRMSDPAIGRFVEVVVSQGRLVGATVVGDKQCASDLSALYSRMLPVPTDPAHLIIRPLASAAVTATSGTQTREDDIVCQCNAVPRRRIAQAVADGCASVDEVSRSTRAGTGCGDCKPIIGDMLDACASPDNTMPALAGSMEG